jgi:predicted secreted protein
MINANRLLALGVLLLLGSAHAADEQPLFDTVGLSAQAQAEVDNDRIQATLFAEREGSDAAKLADAVNQDIAWALAQLKPVAAIDTSTPAYQTSPIYQQGRITGWRVRQTLRLESADMPAMSAMLGKLQARLGLQSVQFLLSPERREAVEEQLIKQALARFTQRASMVAAELGRGGYRLVGMQVNSGGGVRPPVPQLGMMRAEAAMAAPSLEGGSSDVQVMVTGTIQLKD